MRPLALALSTALAASAARAAPLATAPAASAPPVDARTSTSGAPTAADPISDRVRARLSELERDGRSPAALPVLMELAALEDELPDLARVGLAYSRVADDRAADPEVRAYARFRLADLERSRGNPQKAQGELAKLAFLDAWWIAGPFDDEGKRGFDEVFPPERGQDLAARFPGKAREVGWRPLPPEAAAMGFAHLGAAVRPAREVVVYALAVVDAPRDERVRLHLGASGAVKVFVNGAPVLTERAYHPARLDQVAVSFGLRRGPNRILVKLCHVEGRLGLYARLADARGEPLRLAARHAGPLPAAQRPSPEKPERVSSALAALERRAREARGPDAAAARLGFALALAERRPYDDRDRRAVAEARAAVELAPRSVPARLLAARLEEDPNRRRAHLEAALEAAPADALALGALAQHELGRGHLARAKRLLDRAIAAAPGLAGPRLFLADLHDQAGLAARAGLERAELARLHPFHPGVIAAAARAARAQDRLEEATALLRKALALRFDDGPARASLVQLLLERGDPDGAARLLEEALRLDPGDLPARLRLADVLAANGRLEEAEAAYATAERIAPEEAEVKERRGQARLRAGRTKDALADFQAALELKPQNPQLKELVRAMEPARERYEAPYALDARALAGAAPAPLPDEDAIVLGDLKVTRVYPSGLSSTYAQTVVKVLTQRGVDAWRTYAASYAPDRQEVKVERARVVKPDGAVVESHGESEHSASEPWYRLYYDTRARQLTFPALAPGDVLEVAVRTDDVASENLLADYFGELVFLGGGARKARSEYVLLTPGGRRLFSADPALPRLEKTERALAGGLVERRWVARDVPRVRSEPDMPGWSEVAPYVHVSTYESWDDVARFYWGLVRDQLQVTPEIRDVALRLAAEVRAERRAGGAPEEGDALALVQAAHRFVVTNTRYVGLEFGIHGFKPYRVDQVLERRFGDCKDKASLTHALLEALGVDSRLVLLRMKRLGRMPEKPASLAVFNHAILYVPRFDLWLDGTASYSGSRDLPGEDRGATVLVVNPGEPARFATIPEGQPEDNRVATRYEIALQKDGRATLRGEARVGGPQAPSWRNRYGPERDRRALLEQAMSQSFPGLEVKEVSLSDLARLEDDVDMRFTLALPRVGDAEGDGRRFAPFGTGRRLVEAQAPLSVRQHDLVLAQPSELRLSCRYALPPGWRANELPPPERFDAAAVAFEVSWREESGGLVAEARLVMKRSRIAAAEYPAFRDLLARADRALQRTVRVGPATAEARSSP
jgi:tetratricopeptide (TPR) repeat protein/transglutaminase-like putative cysteine protease